MPRYTLMDKIGEGGMGVVYRALQNPLGREVAVKVLRAEMASDGERLKRFQREVAACIKLAHPHIVKILDSGERDGKHYYVMELLADGRPLDALLAEGPLGPGRACELTAQVLDALEHCHASQIIHRDLKPANVMIRHGGLATLMDFGLAKDLDATTLLTQAGQSVGTPRYMAPEMFTDAEPTPAVDIWATGCLLYEMLTSKAPFDGKSIMEIATRISCGEYLPARQLRPELPHDTDALIARFLNRNPAERFASAQEAAEAVREWGTVISRAPGQSPPGPTAPMSRPRTAERADALRATDRVERPADRAGSRLRRRVRLAAILAGAAVFGVVLGTALRPSRPPPPPAAGGLVGRSVGDLTIHEGASSLEVAFDSPIGSGLLVEAETRGEGPPKRTRVPAELTSSAGRTGLVADLPPATRVRVRVLGPDGTELAWRDVSTRSIPEVAKELVAGLEELAPFANGQKLVHELERAQRVKDEAGRGQRVSQVRRHWELRLRELMSHRRVEALIGDLAPLAERLLTASEVPPETRRRLYEQVYELAELEEIAANAKVPMPSVAGRLISRGYGFAEKPSLSAPRAVVYQLGGEPNEPQDVLKPAVPPDVIRLPGEHLVIYSDLRRAADMFVGTFGEGFVMSPDAVPLPPPGRVRAVELTAMASRTHPLNGIRVMVSSKSTKDRSDWRTVAVLRFREAAHHAVSHTIPVDLLSERPLYLRLEFAYSPVRFVFQHQVEQECWLNWFAVAWQEEAAPVGASASPH